MSTMVTINRCLVTEALCNTQRKREHTLRVLQEEEVGSLSMVYMRLHHLVNMVILVAMLRGLQH